MKIRNKATGEIVDIPDQQPGLQRVGPANTMRPLQEHGASLGNQRTAQQIQSDRQLLPLQVQKARADAMAAEAEAKKATAATQIDQRSANLRAMANQINRVQQLYRKGPGATSGASGLLDYLPTPANKQFDTAGAGLAELGLAAFRVPGVGSQSDAELRAFVEANKPRAADYDAQIQEKLRNLQNRLRSIQGAPSAKSAKPAPRRQEPKVIDFNDLPE